MTKQDPIDTIRSTMTALSDALTHSVTIGTLPEVQAWITKGMPIHEMNLTQIRQMILIGHMFEGWLNSYQLFQSALNKERIENLEAKIEDLTGEVTHAD